MTITKRQVRISAAVLVAGVLAVISQYFPPLVVFSDLMGRYLLQANVSADDKQNVEVVYAIVPRSALPDAVRSKEAALAEEAKLLETKGRHPVVENVSVVVFIKNNSRLMPLVGTLRVWMPGPRDIKVNGIPTRDYSIYVIDSGDTVAWPAISKKPAEWLSLKVLL